MPMKKSYPKKKAPARRRAGARKVARMPKKIATGNFASLEETASQSVQAGVATPFKFSLSALSRAPIVATCYQYYRITGIRMSIKPRYDTFEALGTNEVPWLFRMIDKSGAFTNTTTVPQLEALGCRPIRFDDKIIKSSLTPSVVIASTAGVVISKTSPWIPTFQAGAENFTVPHFGYIMLVSKMNDTDETEYDCDITYTVQFKKPYDDPEEPEPPAV